MTPRNVSRPILARVVAISLVSNVGALAVGCATTVEMNYAASRGSVSAGFREVSARRIKTTPLAFGRYRSVKTGVDKTKLQYLAFEVKKKASQPAFLFARPPLRPVVLVSSGIDVRRVRPEIPPRQPEWDLWPRD